MTTLVDALRSLLGANLAYVRAEATTVNLWGTDTSVEAARLWLEAKGRTGRTPLAVVSAEALSPPTHDADGARFYAEDVVSLDLEVAAAAPETCLVFINLGVVPSTHVCEVVSYVDEGEDDRVAAIALQLSDGSRLLLCAERGDRVSLRRDPAQIEACLADLDNDGIVVGDRLTLGQ